MKATACLFAALLAASAAFGQTRLYETFDCYADGSNIVGQDGWEGWYSGFVDAQVSSAQAFSAPHSLRLSAFSDIVHQFSIDDGQWVASAMTYVPSTALASGYFIIMNQYGSAAIDNWSVQVEFDPVLNRVQSEFGNQELPIIKDQWVELRCDIDLTNDLVDIYYGGTALALDLVWTNNASTGGITSIAAFDLFSNGIAEMYFDNVSLLSAAPCAPCDTNCDGSLNGQDIGNFISALAGTLACPCSPCVGDADENGSINGQDIDNFIDCLSP